MIPNLKPGDRVTSCKDNIVFGRESDGSMTKTVSPTRCLKCVESCGRIDTILSVVPSTAEGGYSVNLVGEEKTYGASIAWYPKVLEPKDLPPIRKNRFQLINDS